MQKIFFTPGPTQLSPKADLYMQDAVRNGICSISHRGKEFDSIFQNTSYSLRKLLKLPQNFHIFFISSATEAMERVVENCVEQHSYHFVNGAFSKRFFLTAQELKKSAEKLEAEPGYGFDFSKADIPNSSELVCFTQNETSTGVALAMEDIYGIKRKYNKLVAVDIVSSVPYVDVDYSMVDCLFFSVQKGFGLPAGLGVLMVNEKAMEKSKYLLEKNCNIGSYHNFPTLLKSAEKNQTPETPNVLGIYLLGRVCDDLNSIGLKTIREETEKKAEMLYNFFESHNEYKPFVKDKMSRSKTVIVANTPNGSQPIIKKLAENGFVVGSGYKDFKETQIRIANFPMHKIEDVERIISILS